MPPKPTPEICKSPSWSDYNGDKGTREKKKADKERKEMEKKQQKEVEKYRTTELKAAKRLSKKPPAAMDTQRMPAALRPSSRIEVQPRITPQPSSRSSSKERRRSSISSLTSLLRLSKDSWAKSSSSRSSAPEVREAVSGSAPPQLGKLRGIETHSRSSSFDTQGSRVLDSDHEYLKDIVSFAYQLQASADEPDEVKVEVKQINGVRLSMPSRQSSSTADQPSINTTPPCQNDKDIASEINSNGKTKQVVQRPLVPRRRSSEDGYFGDKENNRKKYPSVKPDMTRSDEPVEEAVAIDVASNELNTDQLPPSPSNTLLYPQLVVSPRDGSSYVHKQRMYRQQQSIASYEDEIALAKANNMTSEERISYVRNELSQSAPKDLVEPIHPDKTPPPQKMVPRNSVTLIENNGLTNPESSDEDASDRYHRYLVEQTQNFGSAKARLRPRISKAEKILGAKCSDAESPPPTKRRSRQDRPVSSESTIVPPLKDIALRSGSMNPERAKQTIDPNSQELQKNSLKLDTEEVTAKDPDLKKPSGRSLAMMENHLSSPTMPSSSTTPMPSTTSRLHLEISSSPSRVVTTASPQSAPKETGSQPSTAPVTESKPVPELSTSDVDPSGLVRKTSLKRPRSDPELQAPASNTPTAMPSFDFLPPLKHQPLSKPKRSSLPRVSFATSPSTIPSSSANATSSSTITPSSILTPTTVPPPSSFPQPFRPTSLPDYSFIGPSGPVTITPVAAGNATHPGLRAFHPPRPNRSSLMGPPTMPLTSKGRATDEPLGTKPLAKMFVICCKCNRWHDLPSKLYEAMALPRKFEGENAVETAGNAKNREVGKGKGKEKVEGRVLTSVMCPWCEHAMGTSCCAGWTAIVYLHESHH